MGDARFCEKVTKKDKKNIFYVNINKTQDKSNLKFLRNHFLKAVSCFGKTVYR